MAASLSDELAYMAAGELVGRMRRRELSPVDVVDAFLDRIESRNRDLNAYVLVLHDDARRRAREAEQALTSGSEPGPLHGLPIALKDLFDFKAGVPNTFGCRPFRDWVPATSATYVARLESAGAIVLGKTNTPEFGHRGITDNLLFGPTSTPFRIGKNAGGSSGGSAAAEAAPVSSQTLRVGPAPPGRVSCLPRRPDAAPREGVVGEPWFPRPIRPACPLAASQSASRSRAAGSRTTR